MNALDKVILCFCRLGVAGLSKWAPGTCGTFLALLAAPWIYQPMSWKWRLFVLVLIFIAGSFAAGRAETLLEKKDPGEVVVDELAGAWIAILPFAGGSVSLLCAAFVVFRIFDIAKPWPIHASEDWLPGGWGVMLDDIIGGLMTMIVLLLAAAVGLLDAAVL
ncbi:MAG: phosphatidylglycerophosphatase A [Desulfovibrionaceae bacterium]|nr:phosphatidylglycerophosphatase A [Desulfovibrionaceae bacterium]